IKVHQLADQHSLQLGTVGSKAKFNFGTTIKTSYGGIEDNVYFDIVNVDRYDAIVGTYFMRKHGIQLDFENDKILICGKPAPILSVGEDASEFIRHAAMRRESQNQYYRHKESSQNMLSGVPEVLPPLREINHKIILIDEQRRYNYYMPRCPDYLKTQLSDKLGHYTRAKWWIQETTPQAAPMLCIPK
ncbi:hypothetical protein GYMLUDRAFT_146844, partial [Collybiopsis luxurians FD-317 M1]